MEHLPLGLGPAPRRLLPSDAGRLVPAPPLPPLELAVFFSWGLAFFEYLLQVPGNKLGRQAGISSAQLKAIAEFFVLVAFIVFNKVVLGEKIVWNHLVGFGLVLAGVGVVLVGPFEAKVFVKSSDNSVLAETFSNASDCK